MSLSQLGWVFGLITFVYVLIVFYFTGIRPRLPIKDEEERSPLFLEIGCPNFGYSASRFAIYPDFIAIDAKRLDSSNIISIDKKRNMKREFFFLKFEKKDSLPGLSAFVRDPRTMPDPTPFLEEHFAGHLAYSFRKNGT